LNNICSNSFPNATVKGQLKLFFAYLFLIITMLVGNVILSASIAQAEQEKSPLVFAFQKQKNPAEVKSAADSVSKYLAKEIGREVKVVIPSDYSATVQALVSKKADFAYTSSLPFLLARRDGGARLVLAEQRKDLSGKTKNDYESVIVARKDSKIKSIEDIKKNAKDLRFVFTSATSTSGFVFANLRLVREGILEPKQNAKKVFKSVRFAGSYTQALQEVAAKRGDVCAVSFYAVEGPKSSKYLPDEVIDQLQVIARTPGVPTHIISARGGLDDKTFNDVKKALLKMSSEKPELLADVYGASTFVEVDEKEHLKNTVEALEVLDAPLVGLVHK